MNRRERNIYENLKVQIDKIFRLNKRQGYEGNERYKQSSYAFAKHLATRYGSQSFKNIRDKHLKSFVAERQSEGRDPSTIKTDLSAIRKLHELNPNSKYILKMTNTELGAERRISKEKTIDRAWTNDEYKKAIQIAHEMNRHDVVNALKLARHFGLRIEEATALTYEQLNKAIHNGFLDLKITKGGIPRSIPITRESKLILNEIVDKNKKGRIFIKHGVSHSKAQDRIGDWIRNHRDKFAMSKDEIKERVNKGFREKSPLTFHGLRHSFSREQYYKKVANGSSEFEARKEVSRLLGHGRDDVTKKYL